MLGNLADRRIIQQNIIGIINLKTANYKSFIKMFNCYNFETKSLINECRNNRSRQWYRF